MPPRAPVAVLSGPATATVGVPIYVDGSQSTAQGGVRKWGLRTSDGATRTSGFQTPPSRIEVRFVTAGVVDVILDIKDSRGLLDTAVLPVTVAAAEPPPPPPPPPEEPVDCVLSEWRLHYAEEWGPCQPDGTQSRVTHYLRDILVPPQHGGAPCGPTAEDRVETQTCLYVPPEPPPSSGLFDEICALPNLVCAYSLRPRAGAPIESPYYEHQLRLRNQGGYTRPWVSDLSQTMNHWVAYDATRDAVQLTMPIWPNAWPGAPVFRTLAEPLAASATAMTVSAPAGYFLVGYHLKFSDGEEVIAVRTLNTTTPVIEITRGAHGTPIEEHAAGARLYPANQSLNTQVWLPIPTEAGHTYLLGYEIEFARSALRATTGLGSYKTVTVNRGDGHKWYEVRTRFDLAPDPAQDIGKVDARSYWPAAQPITPQVGQFVLTPDRTIRYWELLDQRDPANTPASLWVADRETDPVLIIDRFLLDAAERTTALRLEFNTSEDRLAKLHGDIHVFVRNVWVLRDVADVAPYLQRPPG